MNQGMQQMGKGQQIAGMSFGQPAGQPRGRTPDNMNEIMALARKMSDSQLADVLAGRSLDIPQFAAMTEAMGRKSLRNAVQGAQAMAQAKQPSVKDRLMAEASMPAGLDQLPAPNMEPMGMADGGIVAFSGEDESLVKEDKNWFERLRDSLYSPSEVYLSDIMRGKKATPPKGAKVTEQDIELMRAGKTPPVVPPTPEQLAEFEREKNRGIRAPLANLPVAPAPAAPAPAAPVAGASSAGGARSGIASLIPSYESLQSKRSSDYLSKLEGLSQKQRDSLERIKREGGGEALMQLGAGLLSAPTLGQGLAKGMPLVASTAAATRKEARAVENLANEYDLNIAKAREAAEKGDMALALQYQQIANQAAQIANQADYQKGMLNVYGQRNALMGESNMLPKVQLGLANADKQALNEAKAKFPMVTKANQAAFDAFVRRRAYELKMENPLTKPYANLGGSDFGGMGNYNVVQSLPKGAKVIDLED
jgi:hypothetical protein